MRDINWIIKFKKYLRKKDIQRRYQLKKARLGKKKKKSSDIVV